MLNAIHCLASCVADLHMHLAKVPCFSEICGRVAASALRTEPALADHPGGVVGGAGRCPITEGPADFGGAFF
jgi:hypothetical protein